MAILDEKELEKLTRLCRIECTEEEREKIRQNLARILNYVDQLRAVNTDGVPPCYHVLDEGQNVWRDDEIMDILPRELFLRNAPSHMGGMIKVPPIMP